MKKRNLEKEIRANYEKRLQAPEMTPQMLEKWHNRVVENAQQNKNTKRVPSPLVLWQKLAIVFCCIVMLLPCILVPTLWPKPETYYGDDEVEQVDLTVEYAQEYIQQNYDQYSFVFDDCEVEYSFGYRETKSSRLVAISMKLNKIDVPFTSLELNLIVDKRYKYKYEDNYKSKVEATVNVDYIFYRKDEEEMYSVRIFVLLEYKNYKLFLNFKSQYGIKDEEFLEKFL